MISQFNCWCTASEVSTFENLSNFVILEQFKDSIPERVATYINKHKVTTPSKAAVLADEYVLRNKSYFDSSGDVRRKTDN